MKTKNLLKLAIAGTFCLGSVAHAGVTIQFDSCKIMTKEDGKVTAVFPNAGKDSEAFGGSVEILGNLDEVLVHMELKSGKRLEIPFELVPGHLQDNPYEKSSSLNNQRFLDPGAYKLGITKKFRVKKGKQILTENGKDSEYEMLYSNKKQTITKTYVFGMYDGESRNVSEVFQLGGQGFIHSVKSDNQVVTTYCSAASWKEVGNILKVIKKSGASQGSLKVQYPLRNFDAYENIRISSPELLGFMSSVQ